MMLVLISGVILIAGMNISCADAPKEKAAPAETKTVEDMSSEDEGYFYKGKVLETMSSGGYTYVNIEQDGKSNWVAVPTTEVKVGDVVAVRNGSLMKNFSSKTLNRTFESILFTGELVGGAKKEEKMAPATGAMPSDKTHSMISPDKTTEQVKVEKIKVEKAEGENAYTVAELHAKRVELNTKGVVLKGQVVKVSKAIMGKNWIHIQDGSGSASDKTNDIIVTSQDVPSVGAVVTAKGTLNIDKDFGMGYFYAVIIEEASIK